MDKFTELFLTRVNKSGPVPEDRPDLGPCWLWLPVVRAGGGYGNIYRNGKQRLAHRVSYEIFVGPIPPGLVIDHLCSMRPCVNPAHLEPVTMAENTRRGRAGEIRAQQQRALTHCKHGHPFSGDNLRILKSGKRTCVECCRRYSRAGAAKRRAANKAKVKPERTHCRKGHAYAEVGKTKSGRTWSCSECSRAKVRAYRERQRALQPPKPPKTECIHGHPWAPENVYTNPRNGERACRQCHNIRTLAAYHARKAVAQQAA